MLKNRQTEFSRWLKVYQSTHSEPSVSPFSRSLGVHQVFLTTGSEQQLEFDSSSESQSFQVIFDALQISSRTSFWRELPQVLPDSSFRERFQELVEEWKVQRGFSSSITEGALCPAYQKIVGMGQPAVPLLLGQLEAEGDDPDQWFWALNAITGCQPVREEEQGDFVKMARRWLAWGRCAGYVW